MAYNPQAEQLLVVDHKRNRLGVLNPKQPSRSMVSLLTLNGPGLAPHAALEYSTRLDSLIYYSASDGANIWRIQCDPSNGEANLGHESSQTKNWTPYRFENLLNPKNLLDPIEDAAQQTRHSIHSNHIYGRFRIASFEQMDLAILVRHVDTPVYVMRLD